MANLLVSGVDELTRVNVSAQGNDINGVQGNARSGGWWNSSPSQSTLTPRPPLRPQHLSPHPKSVPRPVQRARLQHDLRLSVLRRFNVPSERVVEPSLEPNVNSSRARRRCSVEGER